MLAEVHAFARSRSVTPSIYHRCPSQRSRLNLAFNHHHRSCRARISSVRLYGISFVMWYLQFLVLVSVLLLLWWYACWLLSLVWFIPERLWLRIRIGQFDHGDANTNKNSTSPSEDVGFGLGTVINSKFISCRVLMPWMSLMMRSSCPCGLRVSRPRRASAPV